MDEMAHSIDQRLSMDPLRVTNGTLLRFWDSPDSCLKGIYEVE